MRVFCEIAQALTETYIFLHTSITTAMIFLQSNTLQSFGVTFGKIELKVFGLIYLNIPKLILSLRGLLQQELHLFLYYFGCIL